MKTPSKVTTLSDKTMSVLGTLRALSNVQKLATFIAIFGSAVWQFQRIVLIRPAILGDEYIYSANARLSDLWGNPVQGDFSNYLFNFVYRSTLVCGDSFYSCAKGLNLLFYSLTLVVLLVVSIRLVGEVWSSLAIVASLAISSVSIYTSLFLPETLFFFLMTLTFYFLLKTIDVSNSRSWAVVGIALGLAALVKPHAFLSLPALITWGVIQNFDSIRNLRQTIQKFAWFFLAVVFVRFGLGFVIAGPQALGLAGQYLGETAVANLTQTEGRSAEGSEILDSISNLFWPMIMYHWSASLALFALPIAAMVAQVIFTATERRRSLESSASLLGTIWLLSLIIIVAIFTGYVTGTGDDHSTRMLLRYYEFLYLFIPVLGLSGAVHMAKRTNLSMWPRLLTVALIAPWLIFAFGGMFNTLTIQIADAPSLAGLIPNFQILSAVSVLGIVGLGLVLFWPGSLKIAILFTSIIVLTSTGLETSNQYQIARGSDSPADLAGRATSLYLDSQDTKPENAVLVIAQTRFDATNAAFWIDEPSTSWEFYAPGFLDLDRESFGAFRFVLSLGGVELGNGYSPVASGDGWALYEFEDFGN